MWYWKCSKTPTLVFEAHSYERLDEQLSVHEDGLIIPGLWEGKPCNGWHDYWDDGVPCQHRGCRIPYKSQDEYTDLPPTVD